MTTTKYTAADAQNNLAELWDKAIRDRDVILLHRSDGAEDLALLAAGELHSLMETAHLLRSPANARRLLAALQRAQTRSGGTPQTVAALRDEFGLGDQNGSDEENEDA